MAEAGRPRIRDSAKEKAHRPHGEIESVECANIGCGWTRKFVAHNHRRCVSCNYRWVRGGGSRPLTITLR